MTVFKVGDMVTLIKEDTRTTYSKYGCVYRVVKYEHSSTMYITGEEWKRPVSDIKKVSGLSTTPHYFKLATECYGCKYDCKRQERCEMYEDELK